MHPLATHAVAETVGEILETLGPNRSPDLVAVFATEHHSADIEPIVATIHEALNPGAVIGSTAVAVAGGRLEVEDRPGLSLWAGCIGPVEAMRIDAVRTPSGIALSGFPSAEQRKEGTLLILADPFSFPVDGFMQTMAVDQPDLRLVGGFASAARSPGGNRLVLDREVVDRGAVAVYLQPSQVGDTVVSQGCRPIGEPFVVTASEQNHLLKLRGQPAIDQLRATVGALDDADRALAQQGLHLGIVRDEMQLEFDRGDFVIRGLMGVDEERQSVVVGDFVDVGSTVQFQVRDADSAHIDLHELMRGREAAASLMFTCNGRGSHLFGEPNHDAEAIFDATYEAPLAGMFCAGELGPVAGVNYLHGFTASVLLFPDVEHTHRAFLGQALPEQDF